ncbi:MAG: hypothetical protein IPO93_05510 [Actinobacteria bacterium]|nr:hypothetical protein [Actinomycetota bacterium]
MRWLTRPSVAIGWISTLALLVAEAAFRMLRPEELFSSNLVKTVPYLFQVFASDDLLQTVKIADLVSFGPLGLWYFHIQPPVHQAILYALALPEALTDSPITSEIVDLRLYVVYAVIYGLLNALVFMWARDLTRSTRLSLIVVVLWAIYPGNLQMATLLDGTYLSLYLITLTLYLLYRFLRTHEARYTTLFLLVLTVTTYTRTIFQIHVVVILFVAVGCFWWMQKGTRRGALMVVDVALVLLMLALPVKQFIMYSSFSTTTFGGYHRTGMLFYDPPEDLYYSVEVPDNVSRNSSVFKSDNNVPEIAADNYIREQLANRWLASHPIGETLSTLKRSLDLDFQMAMQPTSEYFPNNFAQGVPWRAPMDRVLSGYLYVILALGVILGIFGMKGPRGSWLLLRRYGWLIALYLMIAGTIGLQNRNDWSEANRLKVFLEIPVWLAATYFVHLVGVRLHERKAPAESIEG